TIEQGRAVQSWTFDALALGPQNFEAAAAQADRDAVAALIAEGLAGKRHVLLRITAFARVGAGQEIFPSQELVLERGRGDKSKTLYEVDGVAAIHSQKIGNAIRTIDDWLLKDKVPPLDQQHFVMAVLIRGGVFGEA